jgi:hypothetical protein
MINEFAFLLSALVRCATVLGHQSGRVLWPEGGVREKPR